MAATQHDERLTVMRLNTWGIAALLASLVVGVLLYFGRDGEVAARIAVALAAVGPFVVVGCVLIVGGLIVEAIRERG